MKNCFVVVFVGYFVSIASGQNFRDLSTVRPIAQTLATNWDTRDSVNWEVVSALAHLSCLVYNDDQEILDHVFKTLGFQEWTAIVSSNTVAYVLVTSEVVVVVVRGSDDIPDWLLNGKFSFIRVKGEIAFQFHRGFIQAYSSIRRELQAAVSWKAKDRKLWVCGHSLGGAIATLCTIDIEHGTSTPKPTLVTFGQPRITDASGAQWMNTYLAGRYLRVVNDKDIVTRVPPECSQYCHSGRCIRLFEQSTDACGIDAVVSSFSNELQELEEIRNILRFQQRNRLSNDTKLEANLQLLPQSFTDHYKENYLRRTRYQRDHSPSLYESPSSRSSTLIVPSP